MSKLDALSQFTPEEITSYFLRKGITVLIFDGKYDYQTTIDEGIISVRDDYNNDVFHMKQKPRKILIEMTEIF